MKGLCPFHAEKTPSFYVEDDHVHCYGCGAHYDHFGFIQAIEGVSFPEAKRILAREAGVEIEDRVYERQDKVFYINDYVQKIWAGGDTGYWESRGYTEETIKKFGLGFADRVPYNEKTWYLLHDAGVYKDGKQLIYDRASVPLKNLTGRIVGFAGRILEKKGERKYINTPETTAYKKSQYLYGLYESKDFIRKLRSCYVVEGYTDVISMHQRGTCNIVATCGTAFTEEHCNLIKRYCNKIVFMYDPDSAGAKATLKSIKVAIAWMMDVYVVPLDCDPDEHQGVLTEIEAVEYLTRQIKGTPNEIAAHIRDVCTAIQDPITAKIYSKKFADQYGVSQSDIESMITYRPVDLEDKLIDLYFAKPELKNLIRENITNFCIIDNDSLILDNEPTGGVYIYKYSPDSEVEAKIIISKLILEMLSKQQAEVIGSSDLDFKHRALQKINEDRKEVLQNIPVQWQ
jgi:DNA primase